MSKSGSAPLPPILRPLLLLALEPRVKVAVLYVAGQKLQRSLPEADPFNYAPRVRIPVLMREVPDWLDRWLGPTDR